MPSARCTYPHIHVWYLQQPRFERKRGNRYTHTHTHTHIYLFIYSAKVTGARIVQGQPVQPSSILDPDIQISYTILLQTTNHKPQTSRDQQYALPIRMYMYMYIQIPRGQICKGNRILPKQLKEPKVRSYVNPTCILYNPTSLPNVANIIKPNS